ncbi:MAG: hypothetical protein ACJ8AT_06700 [Hyalangium sp.]|uniref:hypothetical protein n=1 Tax=Hyalangium sp. TaxID=2028555 RepID=UPI00389A8444
MRLWLILFLLVSLHTARAQESGSEVQVPPPPELAPPLIKAPDVPEPPPLVMDFSPRYTLVLEQGERVRVETARGERQSGELVSLTPGALSLQASPDQVANFLLTDVQWLETRKRSPGYGAMIGGGTGVVLGSLSFAFLCVLASEGDSAPGAGGCALVGGLVVGALGAGVGTLLGLAVPHWSTVYDKAEQGPLALHLTEPSEEVAAHWFSGRGPVGEVGLQFGYGRDMGIVQPTEGWGGRLHLLALIGPYLAVGPEVAWYSHIGTETVAGFGHPFVEEHSLFQLGGLVRGGVEIGPTRTSVLLGLGLHDNRSSHVGVSAGGEVELDLGKSVPPLALEVRYHFPIDRDEFEAAEKFLTFGVGSRLRW